MSYTFRGAPISKNSETGYANLTTGRKITVLNRKGFQYLDFNTMQMSNPAVAGGHGVTGTQAEVEEFLGENSLNSGAAPEVEQKAPAKRAPPAKKAPASPAPSLKLPPPPPSLSRPPVSPLPPRPTMSALPIPGSLPVGTLPRSSSTLPPVATAPKGVMTLPTVPPLPSRLSVASSAAKAAPPLPMPRGATPGLPTLPTAQGAVCVPGTAGSGVFTSRATSVRDVPRSAKEHLCHFHVSGLQDEGEVERVIDGDTIELIIGVPLVGLTRQTPFGRGHNKQMKAPAYTTHVTADFWTLFSSRLNGVDAAEHDTLQGAIAAQLMRELFAKTQNFVYYRTGMMDKYGRLLVELYGDRELKTPLNRTYVDYEWEGPDGFTFPEDQRVLFLAYTGGTKNDYMKKLPTYHKSEIDDFMSRLSAATKDTPLSTYMKKRKTAVAESAGLGATPTEGDFQPELPDVERKLPEALPFRGPGDISGPDEQKADELEYDVELARRPVQPIQEPTFQQVPVATTTRAALPVPPPEDEELEELEELENAYKEVYGEGDEGEGEDEAEYDE